MCVFSYVSCAQAQSDALSVASPSGSAADGDLYAKLKSLQRELELVEIQEEYIKDEQKNLKIELLRAQEEVKRIQSVPLVIGQFWRWLTRTRGSFRARQARTITFVFCPR